MKKRFLTMATACLLSVGCIFGAAACGGAGGNGETSAQVTEEQWKSAFDTVIAAENYTVKMTMNSQYAGNEDTTYKFTSDKQFTEANDISESRILFHYVFKGDNVDYCIYNSAINYATHEPIWRGYASKDLFNNKGQGMALYYFTAKYSKDEIAADDVELVGSELKDLYSEFTYADGEYKATLLFRGQIEFVSEITLRFTDEKIMYFNLVAKTASDDGETVNSSMSVEFSDYGMTDFTVPADVQEILDGLKENN